MSDGGPEYIAVDPDMLTIGEVEEVEELAGISIDTFSRPDTPKAKFMRAMAFVTRRRTHPDFTWEQAGRHRVRIEKTPIPPTDDNGSALSEPLSDITE